MNAFKPFVALLLIALFGFTIGSEVFASHSEFLPADHSHSVSASDADAATTLSSPTDKADCTDPCHVGQCHFGHCSVVVSGSRYRSVSLQPTSLKHTFTFQHHAGPALKGLRRPPRLSQSQVYKPYDRDLSELIP